MNFDEIISAVNNFVWGPVMLTLLVGTGVFLTIRLKFLPWRNLGYAIKSVFSRPEYLDGSNGDITPFQSLMTALAATIGTGNIVGVATAMVLGGPGALVWMWIAAIFGLSTKYSESVLAVKYRVKKANGQMAGGPMYALEQGFPQKQIGKILAFLFALFASLASFGIGNMTQSNSISDAILSTFNVPNWITGLIILVLVFIVLVGGIQSIGRVCGTIVPIMGVFYFLAGIVVIIINHANLLPGIEKIFQMAFSTRAAAGGAGGMIIAQALRYGVARGVFSNEAGLGSAPIAAAAAQTQSCVRQGLVSMTGTFIDTIVICTMTGLSIVSTGSWNVGLEGVNVTIRAFQKGLPIPAQASSFLLMLCLVFFAFTTILGWDYYGERCLEYLSNRNKKAVMTYRLLYVLCIFFGPYMTVEAVWTIADIFNALMAFPNLVALIALSGVVVAETREYFKHENDPRILTGKELED